jgi:hypothetical protein
MKKPACKSRSMLKKISKKKKLTDIGFLVFKELVWLFGLDIGFGMIDVSINFWYKYKQLSYTGNGH